jgi:FkbM family methyltransferase
VLDLPVGELVTTGVARFGCYEKETVELVVRLLKVSRYFVDVGGHFGLYTLAAAKALGPEGRVVTVEPNPENYLELLGNIQLNDCTNVYPVLAAAGAADGVVGLQVGTKGNTGSTRTCDHLLGGGILVPSLRLADLLPRLGVPQADVVKMDVEGSEPAVLDGLLVESMPLPKHIIFEYLLDHFATGRAVAERLSTRGYKLRQVNGHAFDPDKVPVNDNLWAALE